jgi:hypothetical protein
VGFIHQTLEILVGAIFRVDAIVIGDIIAVVGRRGHDRHEPDTGDAQVIDGLGRAIIEIVQFLDQPVNVADAVVVAVIVAALEDFVEDGVAPPAVASTSRLSLLRGAGRKDEKCGEGGEESLNQITFHRITP